MQAIVLFNGYIKLQYKSLETQILIKVFLTKHYSFLAIKLKANFRVFIKLDFKFAQFVHLFYITKINVKEDRIELEERNFVRGPYYTDYYNIALLLILF